MRRPLCTTSCRSSGCCSCDKRPQCTVCTCRKNRPACAHIVEILVAPCNTLVIASPRTGHICQCARRMGGRCFIHNWTSGRNGQGVERGNHKYLILSFVLNLCLLSLPTAVPSRIHMNQNAQENVMLFFADCFLIYANNLRL